MSGAGGGTRTPTGLPPTDFRTSYGFRRRSFAQARFGVFVVWTIPSPCPGVDPGFRCCPSSLYTFPLPGLARDCRREVSPSLGSSASAVSRGALKAFKSVASAIPPRPRGAHSYTGAVESRQDAFAANTRRVCSDFGPCSCRVWPELATC
jgi:hypothetical protein